MRKIGFSALLAVIFSLGISVKADANEIFWGFSQNITSASDVSTLGTSVLALNASGFSDAPVVVNSVTFQTLDVFDANGLANFSTTFNSGRNDSIAFGFGGLTGGVADLVQGGFFGGGTPTPTDITHTFSGLTVGGTYEIQLFINDSRTADGRSSDWINGLSDGNGNLNVATLNLNNGPAGPTTGDFITGTFTADTTTQSFTTQSSTDGGVTFSATGSQNQINALQLRLLAVPEPTSGALLFGGLLCGLVRRRRK